MNTPWAQPHGRRPLKELVHKRDELVAQLRAEAKNARREHPAPDDQLDTMPDLERHRVRNAKCQNASAT